MSVAWERAAGGRGPSLTTSSCYMLSCYWQWAREHSALAVWCVISGRRLVLIVHWLASLARSLARLYALRYGTFVTHVDSQTRLDSTLTVVYIWYRRRPCCDSLIQFGFYVNRSVWSVGLARFVWCRRPLYVYTSTSRWLRLGELKTSSSSRVVVVDADWVRWSLDWIKCCCWRCSIERCSQLRSGSAYVALHSSPLSSLSTPSCSH